MRHYELGVAPSIPHGHWWRATPDALVRLNFIIGAPVLYRPESGREFALPPVNVITLHTRPYGVCYTGEVRVIGVQLQPWALFAITGRSYISTPNSVFNAAEVLGLDLARLLPALATCDHTQAAQLVNGSLNKLFKSAGSASQERIAQATSAINKVRGIIRASTLSDSFHLTSRRLQQLFAQRMGVSAKVYARLVRFHEGMVRMHEPDYDPMRVVAECGFYDQPHLIREFKAFTSATPSAFRPQGSWRLFTKAADLHGSDVVTFSL